MLIFALIIAEDTDLLELPEFGTRYFVVPAGLALVLFLIVVGVVCGSWATWQATRADLKVLMFECLFLLAGTLIGGTIIFFFDQYLIGLLFIVLVRYLGLPF